MSLEIQLVSSDPLHLEADVLVVSVFQGAALEHPLLSSVNQAWQGALAEHLKHADFQGKKDQSVDIATLGRIKARRLLILGLGNQTEFDVARSRAAVATGVRSAMGGTVKSIALVP